MLDIIQLQDSILLIRMTYFSLSHEYLYSKPYPLYSNIYKASRHACLALITSPNHNIPMTYVDYIFLSQHTLVSSCLSHCSCVSTSQHIRVSHLDYFSFSKHTHSSHTFTVSFSYNTYVSHSLSLLFKTHTCLNFTHSLSLSPS